jgi:8-oxo-dGTP pyrophosphatase MutT (NUDIX family)
MKKFTSIKPKDECKVKKNEVLYSDDNLEVIKYEDWSIVKQKDFVVCIPYLIESNQFVIRYEYIPTFKYADGQEYHITAVGGGVEIGETHDIAILRELEEETGIVLNEDYQLERLKPLFISKGSSNKVYPYIIPLHQKDYHEVTPSGDGTKHEKLAKSVNVDAKFIDSLNTSDIITDYLLIKLKDYLNLKQ